MRSHPDQPDDVDGAALDAIIRRFRDHHGFRLARTGERLISRHRRVLEALPMLYHRNHPSLPGYVGPEVPHGIAGFRPASADLQALRAVARSYVEPRLQPAREDLHGIYLMGSGGTVGQTRGSDIDLWVCCDSLLHATLWPKVRMIDRWAADLGLELHTFLVDPDVLRTRQRLPGTRIPMLVLDEFYRTGALMAGRFPLWWLVSEDDPVRYQAAAERLLQGRFVSHDAVVDFGPVARLPAAELAQAAITELDRALQTPHKSLLKLKLMEAYAQAPELGAVSSMYRARIHAGETDPLALDPYLLLYEHVERHLRDSGRADELTFARTLLIGKAAESLSWQREDGAATGSSPPLLERFAAWGFAGDEVARFRNVQGWTMQERRTEHRRIMTELHGGIELVDALVRKAALPADQAASDDERQLQWLNETRLLQLRVAVNHLHPRDSRAIPVLHPALINRRRPIPLQLAWSAGRWIVREGRHAVMPCTRLVEAVVWAELNGGSLSPSESGSLSPGERGSLSPGAADNTLTRSLAQVLQGLRSSRRPAFAFINAEAGEQRVPPWQSSAGAAADAPSAILLSQCNDPLDYGAFHQLHLETLDLLLRDGKGHWRLQSLCGDDGVLNGLGELLVRPPAEVSWHVVGGRERFHLAHRLERLHILANRILDMAGAAFVLPFGADTVTIRRCGDGVESRRHDSLEALQDYLRSTGCGTIGVDPVSPRLQAMLRAS